MKISGEVMIVNHRLLPHTGSNDHRAVKHCPDAAFIAVPAHSTSQNDTTVGRRPSRRVTNEPPTRMTA